MKLIILILSIFLSFNCGNTDSLDVEIYTLDNGLTVMLNEDHNETSVFGAVVLDAGGKRDPSDATGIAHYLEHVLFKGTSELGTTDYEKEKVFLDSIAVLYDELALKKSDKERLSIQKHINKLSGMHIDSLVREYSTYVLVERPELGPWYFSHDQKINHLDVRLELALADFNMGYFTSCRDNLQSIYNDTYYQSFPANIVKALTMNVETLAGRAELAQTLQSLQQTLKNI